MLFTCWKLCYALFLLCDSDRSVCLTAWGGRMLELKAPPYRCLGTEPTP